MALPKMKLLQVNPMAKAIRSLMSASGLKFTLIFTPGGRFLHLYSSLSSGAGAGGCVVVAAGGVVVVGVCPGAAGAGVGAAVGAGGGGGGGVASFFFWIAFLARS